MDFSHQIIYKDNRQEFIDLFLNETPTKTYSLQPGLGRKCRFRDSVRLRFPGIPKVWNMLTGYSSYPVVKLSMPNGTFFVHRNGHNIGRSNYAILDATRKHFHFTVNIKEALDTVELLGCDKNELPLLMGRVSDKLLPELERRLKET